MKRIRFFCEGITDQIFISDVLFLLYEFRFENVVVDLEKNRIIKVFKNSDYDIKIENVGGCSNLNVKIWKDKLRKNIISGGVNIVIFDADYTHKGNGNKGFKSCKQKLEKIKQEVDFEYYIWPNNNEGCDGEIESLLKQLIPQTNDAITKCIENQQLCLKSIEIDSITLRFADEKNKLNFYLHTISEQSNLLKRDYKDKLVWNLNFEEISDLKNFKEFLDNYFL